MEIRKLNSLRGLAALIVAVSHYSNNTQFLSGFFGTGAGQFGVMLFFILSGFLMSYLYMNQPFNKAMVYQYGVARIARVIPLFLLVVFLSYSSANLLYNIPNIQHLMAHLLFLFGTSVLWTIPVEIHFYLLFILLWWFYQKWEGRLYLLLVAIVALLIFLGLPRINTEWLGMPIQFRIFEALPYFLTGLVLGQVYRHWSAPKQWQSGAYLFSLLFIVLLFPQIFQAITGVKHGLWKDVGVLLVVGSVFFSLVFLVPDDHSFLTNSIGDFLGKISYSLYLLHEPVLRGVKQLPIENTWLLLVIFLSLSVLVAALSYFLFENPARRMIRHWGVKKNV
ncbi:acyltransferase family protein [Thioflexithrix psekupsensis]|uniref:Acyltransferase 3 domain-containing protein n=1 Tax=Thioflexithrix psekupsensis TaxID=1570016 RepID=A0A251X3L1_9GAMM|nr:acyltransferase [Thioflexithrix psekupsensis]OUD11727.1 hypothetical protein TPSD3_16900 [Thioflexithrix psekupsensis]